MSKRQKWINFFLFLFECEQGLIVNSFLILPCFHCGNHSGDHLTGMAALQRGSQKTDSKCRLS